VVPYGGNREGHRVSTARLEPTVDQLVDWRMEKKQAYALDPAAVQMLLHARCAHPVVALRIIADPDVPGDTKKPMTPILPN
jgi:hypothetical protein